MKLLVRCMGLGLFLAVPSATPSLPAPTKSPDWNLSPVLVRLSARAQKPAGWPALRAYARRERNASWRGFAYFVLGVQEAQSKKYLEAARDLASAATTDFPFADLATYLAAAAAEKNSQPARAVALLSHFGKRYPESFERIPALQLLAAALLETGQEEQTIRTLAQAPEARQQPELALLLAQAYQKAGDLELSAQGYEYIYDNFPTAPSSTAASSALTELKAQLGAKFPVESDAAATTRADKLASAGRIHEALAEYNELLATRKASPRGWPWNLGRARCLIRLGRSDEALETLVGITAPTPELDAERLAVLADAYAAKQDETGLMRTLDELKSAQGQSKWYEAALARGASSFMLQDKMDAAVSLYVRLLEAFPGGSWSELASWRVAWITYLQGHSESAEQHLLGFVLHYPNSAHVPAALFYIARWEEAQKNEREARAIYELLNTRYVHDYYALRARERLKTLRSKAPARTHEAAAENLPMAQLEQAVRPLPPLAFDPCRSPSSLASARPALVLDALHLAPLAIQALQARIAKSHPNPELTALLARLEAAHHQRAPALLNAKRAVPDYPDRSYQELPSTLWNLLYPQAHWASVRRLARLNHLDPYVVMAVIRQESAFNPRAVSSAGALGLMQILPDTAGPWRRRRIVSRRLLVPAYNLRFGCHYLRQTLDKFHGNVEQAIAAYNAGESRVAGWITQYSLPGSLDFAETIPWTETQEYVQAVVRDAAVYRALLTRHARFKTCR